MDTKNQIVKLISNLLNEDVLEWSPVVREFSFVCSSYKVVHRSGVILELSDGRYESLRVKINNFYFSTDDYDLIKTFKEKLIASSMKGQEDFERLEEENKNKFFLEKLKEKIG